MFWWNRRVYVQRKFGKRVANPCIIPTVKYEGGSVMVGNLYRVKSNCTRWKAIWIKPATTASHNIMRSHLERGLWFKDLYSCKIRTQSMLVNSELDRKVRAKQPISAAHFRRCPWYNGYRRRKLTRRHEFKSWTRLIAFHIALIPLGKVWIQLFSLQLWVNSRTDWVLQPWRGN